jgi:hypothetical protein
MTIGYYGDNFIAKSRLEWCLTTERDTFFDSKTVGLLSQPEEVGEPISNDTDPTTWTDQYDQILPSWITVAFYFVDFGFP